MMVIGYIEKIDEEEIPVEFLLGIYEDAQEAVDALQTEWIDCSNENIEYFFMGHKTGDKDSDYKITSLMDNCPAMQNTIPRTGE